MQTDDFFSVAVKRDGEWEDAGDLTFDSGKLTRIGVTANATNDKPSRTFANALYDVVSAGEKRGLVNIWTARDGDASNQVYHLHLVFKDREVVITSFAMRDGVEGSSIITYFPRTVSSRTVP